VGAAVAERCALLSTQNVNLLEINVLRILTVENVRKNAYF
jgi:hypothetical protein